MPQMFGPPIEEDDEPQFLGPDGPVDEDDYDDGEECEGIENGCYCTTCREALEAYEEADED